METLQLVEIPKDYLMTRIHFFNTTCPSCKALFHMSGLLAASVLLPRDWFYGMKMAKRESKMTYIDRVSNLYKYIVS